MSCDIEYIEKQLLFLEQNRNFPKTTLSTFQKCLFELWRACCFGCNWKSCFENFLRSLHLKKYVFLVQMQSHVLAALIFERCVWYFSSLHLAFEMSSDTEYLEKQLLIFSETWSPSFCIVCNCFDVFRTIFPKNIGQFQRKQNTKFPKRRWVRSKNVFFWRCSGCNQRKLFWELPQISLLGTLHVFLFKCRVTFWLR